jgi:hypothetical protein
MHSFARTDTRGCPSSPAVPISSRNDCELLEFSIRREDSVAKSEEEEILSVGNRQISFLKGYGKQ